VAAAPPPPEVQLAGPEPKRFSVGKGQLKDVLTASWASLFRFGSGVFNMGYSGKADAALAVYSMLVSAMTRSACQSQQCWLR
jgi:hypothetical protein